MSVPGEVKIKASVDGEETTFKLAKSTTAATDPVDLLDWILAGGILEARPKYLTDNTLAFCRPQSRNSSKNALLWTL